MQLKEGSLLQGGKYRIVRFISSGGFGCTYEAEHVMLRKRIAVKEFFVKDFCNRDEETAFVTVGTTSKKGLISKLKQKFIDEARSIFDFHHPGIVRVNDVFEENNTAYYVMDYIDGKSLKEIVDEEGALSESRALRYIRQVADALEYVHAHNRLHLDIKPGNIMIDNNDHAILIDFGTSKQYDEVNGENTSTLLGHTAGYAPPEQVGNDLVKFTPATDIYALGATLYKLLSGVTPISSTLRNSGDKLAPLPKSIRISTCKTVDSAMKLNRHERIQDIITFQNRLFNICYVKDHISNTSGNNKHIQEQSTLIDNFYEYSKYNNIKNDKSTSSLNEKLKFAYRQQNEITGKFGFIDETNKIIIPFEYDYLLKEFREGICGAVKGGKCGYINFQNEIILPFQNEIPENLGSIYHFKNGVGRIRYNYIDWRGVNLELFTFSLTFGQIFFLLGLVVFWLLCLWGTFEYGINIGGLIILLGLLCFMYFYLKELFEDYGRLEVVVPSEVFNRKHLIKYDDYGYLLTDGMLPVKKNGKWGFINKRRKEIIPTKYEWVSNFIANEAWVIKDGKIKRINKQGKERELYSSEQSEWKRCWKNTEIIINTHWQHYT